MSVDALKMSCGVCTYWSQTLGELGDCSCPEFPHHDLITNVDNWCNFFKEKVDTVDNTDVNLQL